MHAYDLGWPGADHLLPLRPA